MDERRQNLWSQNVVLLKQFQAEFGRLPKDKEEYKGVKLGYWCTKQKQAYRQDKLDSVRRDILAETGMFDTSREQYWEDNLFLLREFISVHGRLPKEREAYNGVNLGKWCKFQKRRAGRGELPEERYRLLQETGLLSAGVESVWEDHFALFVEFLSEHGREPITREEYKGFTIGKWYKRQREAIQNGTISEERYQKLLKAVPELAGMGGTTDKTHDRGA